MNGLNEKHLATLRVLSAEEFTSPTQLAKKVYPEKGAEWAAQRGSSVMSPICKQLVAVGYAERNSAGRYRLTDMGISRLQEG